MNKNDKETIKKLLASGVSKEIVASSYSITIAQLDDFIKTRVRGQILTEEEIATINHLYAKYRTVAKVSRETKLPYWVVKKEVMKRDDYVRGSAKRRITKEEKETVIKMFNAGCKAQFIADVIGIHVVMVYKITEGHRTKGIKQGNRLTKEQQTVAMEMYENGVPVREIAEKINVYISSIYRLIKRWKK